MKFLISLIEKVGDLRLPTKWSFLFCFLMLLIIPFKIHTYNYAPQDDAKRHVAKALSGREWSEILVMDEQYQALDHNEGWHVILTAIHNLGANKESMLLISTIGLSLVFLLAGLFLFQNTPWAWIASLILTFSISSPARFLLGRPFIFSASIFYMLLYFWAGSKFKESSRILITVVFLALAGWIHGAWYLFVLLPAGLFLAQQYRAALLSGLSWLGGSILAGLLNGHPVLYLVGQIRQSLASVDSAPVTRLLVSEFQPFYTPTIWILLGLGAICLKISNIQLRIWTRNPAFWLVILCWILGLSNGRFWWDWGNVALLYLLAVTIKELGTYYLGEQPKINMCHTGILMLGVYLLFTTDISSRWSNNDFSDPLSLSDSEHIDWLPEPGGLLYADDMVIYYSTFYENPRGDWQYVLGHEPALMPPDLLAIYRQIQFYRHRGDHLYLPWVERMTFADRLVLTRSKSSKPNIDELEWNYAAFNTWVGRLPRGVDNDDS